MAIDSKPVALRFNDCINRRDLEGLAELMPPDHIFIDTAGNTTRGREAMAKAWARFFQAFPDYRNIVSKTHSAGDTVILIGRSECSEPALEGPAIWKAVIRSSQVAEWRVYEDTAKVRRQLGIE